MKKIALITLTLTIIISLIYFNFIQPEELKPMEINHQDPLESKVVFENTSLDLSDKNKVITFGELIAVTGKTIFQWDFPAIQNPWYTNYVEMAISKEIISDETINFNSTLTYGEAINFFVNVLEIKGENRYPIQIDFYEKEISKYFEINNKYYDNLIKAYAHGILFVDIKDVNLSMDLTKGQAYNFLNAIENESMRVIPFIVSDEYKESILINQHSYPTGVFFSGNKLVTTTNVTNTSNNNLEFWYGLSFQDKLGKWYDMPAKKISLSSNKSTDIYLEWEVPEKIVSGDYHIVCSLWDKQPQENQAKRIAHMEAVEILSIYNYQENFNSLDTDSWKASTFTLGKTDFLPENVSTRDNKLIISMPAKTFRSGEIQSKDFKSYGSYEIRMKLPDAKGSITGFFMYKAPDYYHEIDIEIYNDKSKEYFLTTYADGKIQNEFLGKLPFDVTSGYNNYRFNYYPDRIDYYINDIFIVSFKNGYSHDPMHLILNCWYPNWLDDGPADDDVSLLVEWIRY